MTANRRFSIDPHPGLPATRVYDARRLEDLLLSCAGRVTARSLARAFGVEPIPEEGGRYVITAGQYREVERTLLGKAPQRQSAILAAIAGNQPRRPCDIDETGLRLLAALGLDVAAMLLLSVITDVADPLGPDGFQFVSPDGSAQVRVEITEPETDESGTLDVSAESRTHPWPPRRRIEVRSASIAPGVFWAEGEMCLEDMPETIASMLAGRPLTALVSHPALDPLALTITKVEHGPDMHALSTDHVPRLVALDQVVETLIATGEPLPA